LRACPPPLNGRRALRRFLAAFGQEGVETPLAILRQQLRMLMRQAGTPAVGRITNACIIDRRG